MGLRTENLKHKLEKCLCMTKTRIHGTFVISQLINGLALGTKMVANHFTLAVKNSYVQYTIFAWYPRH